MPSKSYFRPIVFMLGLLVQQCSSDIITTTHNEISYGIVGIFEQEKHIERRAFNESMLSVKEDDLRLRPVIVQPSKSDSYSVWRDFCAAQNIFPIAVFGPQSPISDGAIRDQCFLANIPHIKASWQPPEPDIYSPQVENPTEEEEQVEAEEPLDMEDNNEGDTEKTFKKVTVNFYPNSNEISRAYAQVIKYYNWKSFAALYEDDFGLMRVQKILAEHSENFPVTVRRLDPNGDNHKIFKELKKYPESRTLLDCDVKNLMKYIGEADALDMVNPYQHYVLTSMDTSMVAEQLKKHQSNFTWLSITNYDQLSDGVHALATRVGRWTSDDTIATSPPLTQFKTEALLMDDVANHLLKALKNLKHEESIDSPENHPCSGKDPWVLGVTLQDQLLKTESVGVSGRIQFDENGKRINYTMYVNEIYVFRHETIGRWESESDGAIIDQRSYDEAQSLGISSKKFIVVSRKAKPWFYDKEKMLDKDGNVMEDELYEGFSVDLIHDIFEILQNEMKLNYTYEFINTNNSYGKYNPVTKKWEGLIGDLLDKKADLAVCDLTITEERKKVVDFSVPFMTLGISILFVQERKVTPGTFSFLLPYSVEVWMYTATAYCVVSIVLFVCSRISPADWENPQPCDKDPEELENIWNFKNCAWLTMGSIMTQGCDILPKAIGSRWVCGMWWFFAMIVCQTYIAQLAASMTSALENEPLNSIDDLAGQTKTLYGALNGGSTLEFFKNSKDKMYQKMYENMMANKVLLVSNNDEGEKRVLNGRSKYAFFMESTTIEYKLKRNCALKKVGGELDSKDYGIAMPANSPFRSNINRAILRLKELTRINERKNKWWNTMYGAVECPDLKAENDREGDLEIENLIGAFLVLVYGLMICLVMTAFEFFDEIRNIVVREQLTHKEAFIQELKASLNFFQLQKPVIRNPSRAPSVQSEGSNESGVKSERSERRQERRLEQIENFIDLEKMTQ